VIVAPATALPITPSHATVVSVLVTSPVSDEGAVQIVRRDATSGSLRHTPVLARFPWDSGSRPKWVVAAWIIVAFRA
jgi:hypothetical protein